MPRGIPNSREPKGPADMSDEALGIGEPDEEAVGGDDPLATLLANPALQSAIDAAVAQRLAAMGGAPATNEPNGLAELAKQIGRMFELQAIQQPGYVKPLSTEEMERRLAGKVEMEALLADYRAKETPPLWVVGENGFFECANALEFGEGTRIRTYLPPAEDFVPQNEEARKVHAAMMRWLGGPTPDIGTQVEAAMRARKEAPLVMGSMAPPLGVQSAVEVVERPDVVQPRKRRQLGSVAADLKEVGVPGGAPSGEPVGPVFVDAA